MKRIRPFVAVLAVASAAGAPLFGAACGDDEALVRPRLAGGAALADARPDGSLACGAVVPTAYESAAFESNAAVEIALTSSLRQLVGDRMKSAEDADAGVTGADLKAIYNGGAPSLRSVSTTEAQTAVDGNLDAWEAALGETWSPTDPEQDGGAASGGRYGGVYVSPIGLHLRENTAATLLAGALLNRVLGLVAAPVTEATIDSMLAAFGATPAGLNDLDAGGPTELLADYAARQDRAAPGPYRRMRAALLTLKAAVAAGDKCKDERDAAVSLFLAEWERTSFGTAIGYLASAASLAADPQKGPDALRSFSAAAGFIASFKGLPPAKRKITDAQIDALLTKIGVETPYKLITAPGDRTLKLNEAINDVALYEAFSPADVEAFRQSL
jgi:hypothetical protein